ncbi:DUF2797 domain-containing protein [Kitasatospora sp. NBC_01287]|uniref:DUF2797 domain-containing protein n=1 Tax=Kitasatospora sp. NBC_01287 TaxID=2903573 RepID=UPI00224F606C|nr:DUF2797 domain-containing protein [Kitasatospora sp. NBC_01287]MCX4744394.1 DUF2797 domain-containing protein [Kitasatospora sp. NBC_01287]
MTSGWLATGVQWDDGRATLRAVCGAREHVRALTPGARISWRLHGPRRCVGAWLGGAIGHRACPHHATVESTGPGAQCQACQSADHGLRIARDQVLDDGRPYRLYLAWFGAGLLKVGLTGAHRGTNRLAEQAALAYTFLAGGPLPAVRRAELTVSGAGIARERLPVRTKVKHWWELPAAPAAERELAAARTRALELLGGHPLDLYPDHPVLDHRPLFELTTGAPPAYREVTALTEGAVLGGELRAPIGRHLFVDTPAHPHPLLLDTRRLAGWTLAAGGDAPCEGLHLADHRRPAPAGDQQALF